MTPWHVSCRFRDALQGLRGPRKPTSVQTRTAQCQNGPVSHNYLQIKPAPSRYVGLCPTAPPVGLDQTHTGVFLQGLHAYLVAINANASWHLSSNAADDIILTRLFIAQNFSQTSDWAFHDVLSMMWCSPLAIFPSHLLHFHRASRADMAVASMTFWLDVRMIKVGRLSFTINQLIQLESSSDWAVYNSAYYSKFRFLLNRGQKCLFSLTTCRCASLLLPNNEFL